jgi:transposase
MAKLLEITVKESESELKQIQKKSPTKYKQIEMLIHIKKKGSLSKLKLVSLLNVSDKSITSWRKLYRTGRLNALLQERRGGHKRAALSGKPHAALSRRLHDPKGGFRSYPEMQQWIAEQFGITIGYSALNQYVKRKFGAKLKVSRKSHVHKSPADEAVFKNTVRTI